METNDKHIYTEAEIRRYLDGQMTPREMHDLERSALDDPFLAEALEGYEAMQEKGWQKVLAGAKQQLLSPNTKAEVVSITRRKFYWMQSAAAVLVLALGSYLAFKFLGSDSQKSEEKALVADNYPVVSTDKSKPIPADSIGTSFNEVENKESSGKTGSSGTLRAKTYVVQDNATEGTNNARANPTNVPPVAVEPNLIASTDADKVISAGKKPADESMKDREFNSITEEKAAAPVATKPPAPAPRAFAERDDAVKQAFKNFVANVVSEDGSPLPFANVTIRNEGIGTYADNQGQFRLISQDSVLTVDVKSMGYASTSYKLNSNVKVNRIVLPESKFQGLLGANKEVSRKSDKGKSAIRLPQVIKDSTLFNVEPADGWEKYNTYVANNLNLDELDGVNKQRSTEVEISFDVQENGTITNITVDAQNCPTCEQEARRLIQQGPQWKVKNGQKSRARIKLTF